MIADLFHEGLFYTKHRNVNTIRPVAISTNTVLPDVNETNIFQPQLKLLIVISGVFKSMINNVWSSTVMNTLN